ncbi:MAG: hypothetical protein IPG25_04450 [Proteobacteria bacterium]|nr:hypothetical protein [Pseudomonadota bacterium]
MAKKKAKAVKPARLGKAWTATDVAKLRSLAKQKLSARAAAEKLGRTRGSVAQKALLLGISFRAINQPKRAARSKRPTA